jgi:ribonuclease E
MPNKMLIDATHPEETRVVVLRGNRVEEFDFESANRKQLRGNIYLAKVTRVEPSLQAAFVDYGGNRHGFLAFSEIHPDYYQIPVADRQALIDEEEREARAADAEADHRAGRRSQRERQVDRPVSRHHDEIKSEPIEQPYDGGAMAAASEVMVTDAGSAEGGGEQASPPEETAAESHPHAATASEQPPPAVADAPIELPQLASSAAAAPLSHGGDEPHTDGGGGDEPHTDGGDVIEARETTAPTHADESAPPAPTESSEGGHNITEVNGNGAGGEDEAIESVGGADAMEEVPERSYRSRRQYKIQEVIKRRQVMLVQVVKEERGTKGAALTTYLSLAGRYSVLMPNTARGGGISRKITSAEDRRRLKDIAQDLEVPEGMGVILRTAGAARTKTEVKRDFEYLLRLWETVRDLTLNSTAPTLVYEEGSLVKRSIRDLYNKDIDEVLVAGDEAFKDAKEFMRMLMPSHAKNVKPFRDSLPVFTRFGIESQLDAMFQPVVQLRSGGYIVLNQAEALVAIDVNSGRATREHHIEDTALKTNMEAAEEIARQLRLRDLAGLIVIDFIDMDEKRNNRTVERRLKESLRHDRARIQVGHISHFGLLEMSRQRIRSSVLESTTEKCPHCGGMGHVRSVSSVALQLLRALEEMLQKGATHNLIVRTRTEIALYLLNNKRAHLRALEERFHIAIMVNADATIGGQVTYNLEKGEQVHSLEQAKALAALPMSVASSAPDDDEDEDVDADEPADEIVDDVSDETTAPPATAYADSEHGDGEHVAGERGEGERGEAERVDGDRGNGRPRRRRRRGHRRDEGREGGALATDQAAEHATAPIGVDSEAEPTDEPATATGADSGEPTGAPREDGDARRRRRGRRGGRRNRRGREGEGPQPGSDVAAFEGEHGVSDAPVQPHPAPYDPAPSHVEPMLEQRPAEPSAERWQQRDHERSPERHTAEASVDHRTEPAPAAQPWQQPEPAPPPAVEPAPTRRRSTVREPAPLSVGAESASPAPVPTAMPAPPVEPLQPAVSAEGEDSGRPRRAGWWSKRVFGKG